MGYTKKKTNIKQKKKVILKLKKLGDNPNTIFTHECMLLNLMNIYVYSIFFIQTND